jgi:DNA segregation ATPase FtsK/SpoIIIE, S-DNA-T family
VILAVQLTRLLGWVVRACWRHPRAAVLVVAVLVIWASFGSLGLLVAVSLATVVLLAWERLNPDNYARRVAGPARSWWCGRVYGVRWYGVMRVTGLTVSYQGREVMPELVTVSANRLVDQVVVRLVRGQSPADVADASDGLAHGLRVHSCRVRVSRPGFVLLELVRRDTLAQVIPALPIPVGVELRALPVGRKEDGSPWTLCLKGTRVLVVGATGAGKNSVLWSMVRALLPAIRDGLVLLATSLSDDPTAGLRGDAPAGLLEHPDHEL